ncbi:hypothetical protein V6B05_07295 [Lactococcus garvieae]|uniref:hypothetical protein n=1 Tax=Lactococcus garvieae TaxID=1363 RepID=UPI001F623E5C|nr:hypothetical protein [Lactococcus garvieae]MCI3861166.1 hypothetical protein [Lactococcus garvieae]
MSDKRPSIKVDMDYVREVLSMNDNDKEDWIKLVRDYIELNDMKGEFLSVASKNSDDETMTKLKELFDRD